MLYISYAIKWAKNIVSCSIHYTEMMKLVVQKKKKSQNNKTKSQPKQINKQTNNLCQTILSVTPKNMSSQY